MLVSSFEGHNILDNKYDIISKFATSIAQDSDFIKAGKEHYTLKEIANDGDLYAKFYSKHIVPAVNKYVNTNVENRDAVINNILEAYDADNFMETTAKVNGVKGVELSRGLALAELGNMIQNVNITDKYQNATTELSIFKSQLVGSVLDRSAKAKKVYNGDYVYSRNYIMQKGKLVEVNPSTMNNMVNSATHVASPLQMKSRIDVECIQPLVNLRQTIDQVHQTLESMKIGNIDLSTVISQGFDMTCDVGHDGYLGDIYLKHQKKVKFFMIKMNLMKLQRNMVKTLIMLCI